MPPSATQSEPLPHKSDAPLGLVLSLGAIVVKLVVSLTKEAQLEDRYS